MRPTLNIAEHGRNGACAMFSLHRAAGDREEINAAKPREPPATICRYARRGMTAGATNFRTRQPKLRGCARRATVVDNSPRGSPHGSNRVHDGERRRTRSADIGLVVDPDRGRLLRVDNEGCAVAPLAQSLLSTHDQAPSAPPPGRRKNCPTGECRTAVLHARMRTHLGRCVATRDPTI